MAGRGGVPPDLSGEKYYIGDKRRKVSTVICVICENVYHESYFEKLRDAKRISKVLGLCPEHSELDITSKDTEHVLSIPARKIIAQVKLVEKEKAQEEILNNVSLHVSQHNMDKNHMTIVGNDEDDYTVMKSEILLLRQLVNEIQDKNKILKELIEEKNLTIAELKLKQKHIGGIPTYAQAANKNNEVQINHIPTVIVTPKTNRDKAKTSKTVRNSLLNDIIVPIKKVQEQQDGSVKIKCACKGDVLKLEELLTDKIGREFTVKHEELLNPRLKIVGIENRMKIEELEADINERNFNDTNYFCNVEHIFTNIKTNTFSAIINVPGDTYDYIRANNYKIYVGHQCLRSFDDLNIMPCYKCGRVGHNGSKCLNEAVCLRCAGKHLTKDCDGKNPNKCTNCCFGKDKYKDDRDVNHIATDTEKCNYLKFLIKKKINNTDYPIKPQIQKFFGYNGNPLNQAMVMKNTNYRQSTSLKNNTQAASAVLNEEHV